MNYFIRKRGRIGDALIKMFFPDAELQKTISTFGTGIYYGSGKEEFHQYLIEHEKVHVKQQKNFVGAVIWWIRYIANPAFRYSQELPAYRVQLEWMATRCDRNRMARICREVAALLSGKTYNNMVSFEKAVSDLSA